jgi:hypothetical protein
MTKRDDAPAAREGANVKHDQLDVPLEDSELLAEVELTTNLMIAASGFDRHLSQAEVDLLLGVGEGPASGHVIPPQVNRTEDDRSV